MSRYGSSRWPWKATILIAIGLAVLVSRGLDNGGRGFTEFVGDLLRGDSTFSQSVERLYAEERSGVVVKLAGSVSRILSDDLEGSRHQRFIVELPSGHTVLVSHNIDLAPRVPIQRGDSVEVRGQYEWNDRGGVVHWTHHDPQGRRSGGWIRHRGDEYR